MVDRLSGLSDKQREAFIQFKESIRDVVRDNHDDQELCKWMIARNFDAKLAEAMYRKSMEWRRKNRIDHILDEWKPPEVFKHYYAGGACGFDKEGFPVAYNLVSFMDFNGLHFSCTKRDVHNMNIHATESIRRLCEAQTKKLGKKIDQITIIMDMEHLGMRHLSKLGVNTFIEVMKVSQDNYPEHMRRCIIINAPRIFPFAYSLIRPFLTEEQKRKVMVLGGNWKSKLLEFIDADQLPVHWGGTMADPDGDPYCRSKICLGGEIPKSWYLTDQDLSYDEGLITKVTVPANSDHKVVHDVTQPGSIIKWEFKTEGYDINFGVFLANDKERLGVEDMESLLDLQKVNSQAVPQDGYITCETPGTYVLVFDNTFSWFRSKPLAYYTEVVPPSMPDQNNSDEATTSRPKQNTSRAEIDKPHQSSVIDKTFTSRDVTKV